MVDLGAQDESGEVNLAPERHDVWAAAKRNTFTGKTYNSVDNISQFFRDRNLPAPPRPADQASAGPRPPLAAPPAPAPALPRRGMRPGTAVEHPKYGTGTVVRREGDGDDAKITVNFSRYGLKKLVEKYAGLKRN
jgi:DNA helicase-2/ATP-dependent DNA helicase PcrA